MGALVSYGASVVVVALVSIQGGKYAAHIRVAGVGCALVVILARGFVDLAVAIIVQTVATLHCGHLGITLRQSVLRADTKTVAGAEFVVVLAWRRKGQGRGCSGTGTLAGISDTVCHRDPIGREDLSAGEPIRAYFASSTGDTTEEPFGRILDAAILLPVSRNAISVVVAGPAEAGVGGYTGEY